MLHEDVTAPASSETTLRSNSSDDRTPSNMALHLCNVCLGLDIRALLALSEAQKTTSVKTTLISMLDVDTEFKPGIPEFYQHQKSLRALKEASEFGCTFCKLIYESRSDSSTQSLVLDKAIDNAGLGQLFIGTSGHNVSKGEIPIITVTQRPAGSSPRAICTFDVFSERDSLPHQKSRFVCMPVALHSASDECKVTALEWLKDCLNNHPLCGPSKLFRRPTRLLNVGSKFEQLPYLEIDGNLSSISWAALSYCWGGDSKFTLRSDTFKELRRGIPLERFPGTLQDAIKVTRNLGLQYLWIDALCIFQDSASDWQAEASRMRDVYSGATITIIASESSSAGAGIYSARPLPVFNPVQLPWGNTDSKVWLRPSFRNATNTAYTNPLQTRGWTLQEGLLASRTLSYRKDQMVWECTNYRKTESGHTIHLSHMFDSKDLFYNKSRKSKANVIYQDLYFSWCRQIYELDKWKSRIGWLPKYIDSSGLNMETSLGLNPYTRWVEIIFEYSKRDFTKDIDILPALGGVARMFASITKDKYCAGMWESEILQSLCWWRESKFIKSSKSNDPSNMVSAKPAAYRAPSWSWASINGGRVTMRNNTIPDSLPIKNIATLIKVCLEPLGKDPFGQLRAGYISIKGSLFPLGDLWADYWRSLSPSLEDFKIMLPSDDTCPVDCPHPFLHGYICQELNLGGNHTFEFEQQHIPHANQTYAAFLIAHTEGIPQEDVNIEQYMMVGQADLLLLESTGDKDVYRRIGVISLSRPGGLSVLDPSIHRFETKNWQNFDEEQWSRYEKETRDLDISVLKAKAWVEVAKSSTKRTTIRII